MILQHHSQPSGYLRGIRLPPTPAPARPPYRRCFACWWDRSPASRQNFAPNEARRFSPTKRGADHLFHLSLRPGLRTLIQTGQGPDRRCCRPSSSAPSRQACAKMTGPSPATCSLNRMPASVLRRSRARAALRSRNGQSRRTTPSLSLRPTPNQWRPLASAAFASPGVLTMPWRGRHHCSGAAF
jgi:hypothetical protein